MRYKGKSKLAEILPSTPKFGVDLLNFPKVDQV